MIPERSLLIFCSGLEWMVGSWTDDLAAFDPDPSPQDLFINQKHLLGFDCEDSGTSMHVGTPNALIQLFIRIHTFIPLHFTKLLLLFVFVAKAQTNPSYGLLIHHVAKSDPMHNVGWSYRFDTRFQSVTPKKCKSKQTKSIPPLDWPRIPPIIMIKPPLDLAPI